MTATPNRPDTLCAPTGTGPGAHDRFDDRAVGHVAATSPRWLKLGLAAALGAVAGATLFATEAQGRAEGRRLDRRRD